MYYIVSIGDDDAPSFDVVSYVNNELKMGDSFCEKIVVNDVEGWKSTMASIIQKSSEKYIPLLFVECHGTRNGDMVLGGPDSHEKVRMKDFLADIKRLEQKCDNKILLATAICHGLYFYRKITKLEENSPCSCVIGSYTKQSTIDIECRYKLFFEKLLRHDCKGNVKSAFSAMKKAYDQDEVLKRWSKGQRYAIITNKRTYYLPK